MRKAILNSDTKTIKKAEIQALRELGFSYNSISKYLDLDPVTVSKYAKLTSPQIDKIKEVMVKRLVATDWQLNQKAVKGIKEHLGDEKRVARTKLWELTGLYKTTKDYLLPAKSKDNNDNVNIQINLSRDGLQIDTKNNNP